MSEALPQCQPVLLEPMTLAVSDLDEQIEKLRGLGIEIKQLPPGPTAKTARSVSGAVGASFSLAAVLRASLSAATPMLAAMASSRIAHYLKIIARASAEDAEKHLLSAGADGFVKLWALPPVAARTFSERWKDLERS